MILSADGYGLMNHGIKGLASYFRDIYLLLNRLINQPNYRDIVSANYLQSQINLLHSGSRGVYSLVCIDQNEVDELVKA
jgi:hypothetical protein